MDNRCVQIVERCAVEYRLMC